MPAVAFGAAVVAGAVNANCGGDRELHRPGQRETPPARKTISARFFPYGVPLCVAGPSSSCYQLRV